MSHTILCKCEGIFIDLLVHHALRHTPRPKCQWERTACIFPCHQLSECKLSNRFPYSQAHFFNKRKLYKHHVQWTLDNTNLQGEQKKFFLFIVCYIERFYEGSLRQGEQTSEVRINERLLQLQKIQKTDQGQPYLIFERI